MSQSCFFVGSCQSQLAPRSDLCEAFSILPRTVGEFAKCQRCRAWKIASSLHSCHAVMPLNFTKKQLRMASFPGPMSMSAYVKCSPSASSLPWLERRSERSLSPQPPCSSNSFAHTIQTKIGTWDSVDLLNVSGKPSDVLVSLWSRISRWPSCLKNSMLTESLPDDPQVPLSNPLGLFSPRTDKRRCNSSYLLADLQVFGNWKYPFLRFKGRGLVDHICFFRKHSFRFYPQLRRSLEKFKPWFCVDSLCR